MQMQMSPYSGLVQLLKRLGFEERIKGSHHIFTREGVQETLNLQPSGNKCKPYQVKQVRCYNQLSTRWANIDV
jgi:predicted RNA binding protein YcfA (HicA-like mRNA interferase family)